MKISQELITQHFTPKLITDFLLNADRLPYSYRYQDLRIEFWENCIFTNYGLISYRDYANYLYYATECKSLQLQVKKIDYKNYLVEGRIKPWYKVKNFECECMLYRQRVKRWKELPQLFKNFDRPFCHHTLAVPYENIL